MIGDDRFLGYRPTVGMMLVYDKRVLMVSDPPRILQWDVPQGGIEKGESAEQALMRELAEELGPEWVPCLGRIIFIGRGQRDFPVEKDGQQWRGKAYYYHYAELVSSPPVASITARMPTMPEYCHLTFATSAEARSLVQPRNDHKAAMLSCLLDTLSSRNFIC